MEKTKNIPDISSISIRPILEMLSEAMIDMEKKISKLELYAIWAMQDRGLTVAQINKILDGE